LTVPATIRTVWVLIVAGDHLPAEYVVGELLQMV
jgi:hypothetical protein